MLQHNLTAPKKSALNLKSRETEERITSNRNKARISPLVKRNLFFTPDSRTDSNHNDAPKGTEQTKKIDDEIEPRATTFAGTDLCMTPDSKGKSATANELKIQNISTTKESTLTLKSRETVVCHTPGN